MNYETAKDRDADARASKPVLKKANRDRSIGPPLADGMITAKEAMTTYMITRKDLESWRRSGILGKYGRGYSEREIRSAIAARDSYGFADSARHHRKGHVRLISATKNRHFIG